VTSAVEALVLDLLEWLSRQDRPTRKITRSWR
jgi:hypothetical protein